MDFVPYAEPRHALNLCEICDGEIYIGQAIRVDEDGWEEDGIRVYALRVRCACCHDAVEAAVRRAMLYAAHLARSCGSDRASDLIQEHARLHADEVAA